MNRIFNSVKYNRFVSENKSDSDMNGKALHFYYRNGKAGDDNYRYFGGP